MHCGGTVKVCRQNGAASAADDPIKRPNAAAPGIQPHKRATRTDVIIASPAAFKKAVRCQDIMPAIEASKHPAHRFLIRAPSAPQEHRDLAAPHRPCLAWPPG